MPGPRGRKKARQPAKRNKQVTVVEAIELSSANHCEACGISEEESHNVHGLKAVPKTIHWHGCSHPCTRWFHSYCTPFPRKTPANFSCAKVSETFGNSCPLNKKFPSMFVSPILKKSYGGYYSNLGKKPTLLHAASQASQERSEAETQAPREIEAPTEAPLEIKTATRAPQESEAESTEGRKMTKGKGLDDIINKYSPEDSGSTSFPAVSQESEDGCTSPPFSPFSSRQSSLNSPNRSGLVNNMRMCVKGHDVPQGRLSCSDGHPIDLGASRAIANPNHCSSSPTPDQFYYQSTPPRLENNEGPGPSDMLKNLSRSSSIHTVFQSPIPKEKEIEGPGGLQKNLSITSIGSSTSSPPIKKKFDGGSKASDVRQFRSEKNDHSTDLPGIKPTYKHVRLERSMLLPARTIASMLKERDPLAYKQFCLEVDPEPEIPIPSVRRYRQGKTFPSEEEIGQGAKEYDRPGYRAYPDRAHTLLNKTVELTMKTKCAEALLDIIPGFKTQSTKCQRITFISKGYFEAAGKAEGQIVNEDHDSSPHPLERASSLSLPENFLRPQGPIPNEDTGSHDLLPPQDHTFECQLCHRVYGTPADDEYKDILIRCAAGRLCKDQKMFHLGCYVPYARTVVDYHNPQEAESWRKLVVCSRACLRISWELEKEDVLGLPKNKGRKKKIKPTIEA